MLEWPKLNAAQLPIHTWAFNFWQHSLLCILYGRKWWKAVENYKKIHEPRISWCKRYFLHDFRMFFIIFDRSKYATLHNYSYSAGVWMQHVLTSAAYKLWQPLFQTDHANDYIELYAPEKLVVFTFSIFESVECVVFSVRHFHFVRNYSNDFFAAHATFHWKWSKKKKNCFCRDRGKELFLRYRTYIIEPGL